jgi:hypothetical protein
MSNNSKYVSTMKQPLSNQKILIVLKSEKICWIINNVSQNIITFNK